MSDVELPFTIIPIVGAPYDVVYLMPGDVAERIRNARTLADYRAIEADVAKARARLMPCRHIRQFMSAGEPMPCADPACGTPGDGHDTFHHLADGRREKRHYSRERRDGGWSWELRAVARRG